MGAKLLKKFDRASEYILMAEEFSGQRIADVMRRGPDSQLAKTEIVQPAMVALSCGYVDLMRQAGENPDFVAGHSLGEYSALYAAGVLTAECVIRLASDRGRLMSQGADGGMVAVKSLTLDSLESILDTIRDADVCLANYNAPSQLVVSGDELALAKVCEKVRDRGGDFVRLNVSGAWHSPLVAVAAHEFEKSLSSVKFRDPDCPIVMGATATLAMNANEIRAIMMRQMMSPVRWYEVIEKLFSSGCRSFHEVGCGKVLRGLMRRIIEDENEYAIQGLENGPTIDRLIAGFNFNKASEAKNR